MAALLLAAPDFEDATERFGLSGLKGDRFAFADIDADGDLDLILQGRRLFLNEKGRFVEVEGALKGARGGAACCADMDGDGRLDVVTLGGDLFLQRKGRGRGKGRKKVRFERVELIFPERQASFGIGDVNGDGLADIMTGGGEKWQEGGSLLYPRRLLVNQGKGVFRDATAAWGLEAKRYGRSVLFCDFDDDGDQDLFFGNYRIVANELWVNDGGRFRATKKCRGVPRRYENSRPYFGHTIAASWADLDGDGWPDLWVSNLVHKFFGQYKGRLDIRGKICDDSNLYRNDGPPGFRFEDRRKASGIPLKPVGDRGVFRGDELWSNCACADYDNDGDLDVFVTQVYKLPYAHSYLFRNGGSFTFEAKDPGFRIFNSYGAAWADVDSDGRMDLITGGSLDKPDGPRAVRLWRNTTSGGGWVAFRFHRPVAGATVRVLTATKVLTRAAQPTMGCYAQQNSDILHFGLSSETIEECRVTWPDGSGQVFEKPPAPGRVHVIRRRRVGGGRARVLRQGDTLRVEPATKGARYHWDFDDDFRTDAVTDVPRIVASRVKELRSVCVRVTRRGVFRKARLFLTQK